MLPCTEEEAWGYSHQPGLPVTLSQPGMPMGVCHESCMWMSPITCNMAFEDDWQRPLMHGQPSSHWRLRPWNNLIQMSTAANILWSSHKPMKKVLNRVQNEGSVYDACLLIPKALFHHNLFIVEEEEGAWNSVFWALGVKSCARHWWQVWMLLGIDFLFSAVQWDSTFSPSWSGIFM